jgi:predicted amidohydrolase YtcJ
MGIALINGKIHTLSEAGVVEALLIENNRIKMIGTTTEITETNEPTHRVIDLHGYIVLPGFIDSHTHIGHSGLESLWVDLSETNSTEEIIELLKQRIAKSQLIILYFYAASAGIMEW